jgi:dolichol kinase
MSQTLALDARPVALELCQLLGEMDPSRWRDGFEIKLRAQCKRLSTRLEKLIGRAPEADFSSRLEELSELLSERVPDVDLPVAESHRAWSGYFKQLHEAYELLGVSMRAQSVPIPAVRPTNYVRSACHAAISIGLVVLVEEVLNARTKWIVPLCFASFFWVLEAWRHYTDTGRAFLLWVFGAVAHPHERHQVNSSTWFGTALAILGVLFDPMLCAVALITLGVGDPAAGLVGRRFGRTKLVGQRSLEGSLAMLFVGGFATFTVLMVWHASLPMGTMLAVSASTALFATVAELFSNSVDDNFSIPLAAAAGGWLALHAATLIT